MEVQVADKAALQLLVRGIGRHQEDWWDVDERRDRLPGRLRDFLNRHDDSVRGWVDWAVGFLR